jgi:hypothetical protein
VVDCRVSGEEALRTPEELNAVRELRGELEELTPEDAALALKARIEETLSNADLLRA